jgi:hypothetical protein
MGKWNDLNEFASKNPAFTLAIALILILFWPMAIYLSIFDPSFLFGESFGIGGIIIGIIFMLNLYYIFNITKNQEKLRDCYVMFSAAIFVIMIGIAFVSIFIVEKKFDQIYLGVIAILIGIGIYLSVYFGDYKKIEK